MKKILILIVVLLNSSFLLFGQFSITSSEFLFTADLEGQKFRTQGDHQRVLDNLGSLSIVDKLEFRTETEEWNLDEQEYTFRVSFNDFKSPKVFQQLNEINDETIRQLENISHEIPLYSRYKQVVEIYHLQKKSSLLDSLSLLLSDKLRLAENAAMLEPEVYFPTVIKIENALNEVYIDLSTLKLKKTLILESINKEWSPQNLRLDTTDWLTLTSLKKIIDHDSLYLTNGAVKIKLQKLKIRELELQRYNQESKNILDFVQLSYAGKDNLTPFNEFSLGFGFNIPTKSTNLRKRNEALINILEDEIDYKETAIDFDIKLNAVIHKMKVALLEYNVHSSYLNKYNPDDQERFENLRNRPETVIELKLELLKLEKKLINLEYKIYSNYIDFLHLKGFLLEFPKINFIQNDFNIK